MRSCSPPWDRGGQARRGPRKTGEHVPFLAFSTHPSVLLFKLQRFLRMDEAAQQVAFLASHFPTWLTWVHGHSVQAQPWVTGTRLTYAGGVGAARTNGQFRGSSVLEAGDSGRTRQGPETAEIQVNHERKTLNAKPGHWATKAKSIYNPTECTLPWSLSHALGLTATNAHEQCKDSPSGQDNSPIVYMFWLVGPCTAPLKHSCKLHHNMAIRKHLNGSKTTGQAMLGSIKCIYMVANVWLQ